MTNNNNYKEAPIYFSNIFFLSLVRPPFDLFMVTFQGQTFFERLRAPRSLIVSGKIFVARQGITVNRRPLFHSSSIICQKRYDLETPPNVGQFKVNQIQKINISFYSCGLFIDFHSLVPSLLKKKVPKVLFWKWCPHYNVASLGKKMSHCWKGIKIMPKLTNCSKFQVHLGFYPKIGSHTYPYKPLFIETKCMKWMQIHIFTPCVIGAEGVILLVLFVNLFVCPSACPSHYPGPMDIHTMALLFGQKYFYCIFINFGCFTLL